MNNIIKLYDGGMSLECISKLYGKSIHSLIDIIYEAKIESHGN